MTRIGNDMRLMAAPVPTSKEQDLDDRLTALLGGLPGTECSLVDPAPIAP